MLSQKKDVVALFTFITQNQDELLDLKDDTEDIDSFFNYQKEIFDGAKAEIDLLNKESDYFLSDDETKDVINAIFEIIKP